MSPFFKDMAVSNALKHWEVSLCPYFFFNCLNRQKKPAPLEG